MRSRKIIFSPLLRSFAAGALLVWVVAQAFCFAHPDFGASMTMAEKSSAGHAATSKPMVGDSCCPKPHAPSEGSICITLKSALVSSDATTLVQPDFQLLYTLDPLTLDVTAVEPPPSFSRQAESRDWVFTPEVCLGSAFRSLAPPFVG